MAEVTNKELRKAREAAELPRWRVAEQIGVSEATVERWEVGESLPTPQDVDRLESLYKADGLWFGWMRSHYDSFRKRIPELDLDRKLNSIVKIRHEMKDVQDLQDLAERSALCSSDEYDMERYVNELRDLIKAALSAIPAIKK